MREFLPSPAALSRETLAVLFATLAAAWIISRWPQVAQFVGTNSVTVRTEKLPP